ncbi:MAG: helix-hairpin-helix domain-containing protein [Thermodesulfobacteriota bacterium]
MTIFPEEETPQKKPYILILLLGFFILTQPLLYQSLRGGESTSQAIFKDEQLLADISRQQPFLLFQAIPINRAGREQLVVVPGIGPQLSRRIIAYRSSHGPFSTLDELLKVNGIGPQKLERLKKYCRL